MSTPRPPAHPSSAQVLAEAAAARAAGHPAAARLLLERHLSHAPRDVQALLLLSHICTDLGERDLALARLRDAAQASGANPAIWRRLIEALVTSGQKSRARKLAAKAPLSPADRAALVALADTPSNLPPAVLGSAPPGPVLSLRQLVYGGRAAEARGLADLLLKSHPNSPALWNLRGMAALAEGAPDQGLSFFREALARLPDYADALANLGLAFALLGRPADAAGALSHALALSPNHADARLNLASALTELDRAHQALIEIDKVLAVNPANATAHRVKAQALIRADRFADARDLLRAMAARDGDRFALHHLLLVALTETDGPAAALAYADAIPHPNAEMLHRRAMLRAEFGHIAEACDELRALGLAHPGFVQTYRDFGLISKWTADEPLLALLERQLSGGGPSQLQDRADLYFALGRARADLGDTRGAFDALRRANAAQDAQLTPAARAIRPWDDQIAHAISRLRIAELSAAGTSEIAPIFIVGMPRSGSTLTEQVLAAHPALVALGEESVISPHFFRSENPDAALIAEAARKATEALSGLIGDGRRPVDKHLHNFLVLGLLAAAFPRARFLHTRRDPRDTCLSIYQNPLDPLKHPYSVDLERLADFYVRYTRLMAHWRSSLGDRILDLDYETLVADPEPQIRAIIDWLGLPWNDACLHPETVDRRVKTISIGQVRKGIGTSSVARWVPYAEELRPLTDILHRAGILP